MRFDIFIMQYTLQMSENVVIYSDGIIGLSI